MSNSPYLTLSDVAAAPHDPDELVNHLRNIGVIPALPSAEPAAPLIPELRPPKSPSGPAMTPPSTLSSGEHLPAMKSSELGELPSDMNRVVPMTPPAMSSSVKSMTAPMSDIEAGEALPSIGNATASTGSVGNVPYYQAKLGKAIAANTHDKMEDHPSFLGKVGHVLGRVGNVALETLAPGVAMNIPGTDLYNRLQERRAEQDLAGAQKEESENKLRGAETEEAQARARKLGAEGSEELVTDGAGNLVGWRSGDGHLHSMQEEGTPQVYKDLANVWEGKSQAKPQKENLEQALTGSIQEALDAGRDPKSDPKVQAWKDALQNYKPTKETNAVEEVKRDLSTAIDKGDVGEVRRLQAKLKSLDPEGAERLALAQFTASSAAAARQDAAQARKEAADEKLVHGFDDSGQEYLLPKGQADSLGLKNISASKPGAWEDAKQNYAALNDMGAKVGKLRDSMKALDQNPYQQTLIQTALRGHPDDYSTRAAMKLMSTASQNYVEDVFSLREAALALPKQTTGGSRVSEPQAVALFNTIPASAGDSKHGMSQLKKFDENLARLWKKVPQIEGQNRERPFGEATSAGGGNAGGGPPGAPAPGMKWQQNKKTGEYRQVPSNQ